MKVLAHIITIGGIILYFIAKHESNRPASASRKADAVEVKPSPEELEDAYVHYATSKFCPPRKQPKAYRVRGTLEPFYTLNIICGVIPVDKALQVARQ